MIKTKLILVDGITGSGKSTTAHYIARQLEKNGIKVRWLYEEEKDHPLAEMQKNKDEKDEDHTKRVLIEYPKKWIDFVDKIKDDQYVYIVESYLFQDVLMFPHFMNDLERQQIKDFSHSILKIASCLNPVLIHFYQKDVDRSLRNNWNRRGKNWTNGFINFFEKAVYCKNRKIKGKKGVIKLWDDFTSLTLELFNEFNFRKIQIENSEQKWENYREQILKFLELKQVNEKLNVSSSGRFCGEYLGKGYLFKIHEKDNRLCFSDFWPDLKLLPVSENEFEIEGFPISFKFYKYKGIKKVKISKSKCYYKEGGIAEKYIPLKINDSILERYCATYWCEADKLERKLYIKDGNLYYWREEGNESLLIPLSDTKFMMKVIVDNLVEFKKVKGEWQFTFDIYEKKPTHSLFVRKEEKV